MNVVVMGVSGSGKTTLGKLLAERLDCEFIEGDDFHPPANVAKMAAGTPLGDADRWPWLEILNSKLREKQQAVLACSALKAVYRERLSSGVPNLKFIFLSGSVDLIGARLKARQHRYMPASLLQSQFATLEPPENALAVDIALPPERCIEEIVASLR